MKYIWGIYNIYMTPSAILFSRRSYVPPSPGSPKVLRVPSPELLLESLELQSQNLKFF